MPCCSVIIHHCHGLAHQLGTCRNDNPRSNRQSGRALPQPCCVQVHPQTWQWRAMMACCACLGQMSRDRGCNTAAPSAASRAGCCRWRGTPAARHSCRATRMAACALGTRRAPGRSTASPQASSRASARDPCSQTAYKAQPMCTQAVSVGFKAAPLRGDIMRLKHNCRQ